MNTKRWALSVPLEDWSLREMGELAREAEKLGYTDAWSGETDSVDIFSPLAAVALGSGMRVGSAIVNVYTRAPAALAASAAGMEQLAPGRFVLGIGAGSKNIIERWNGGEFARPVQRVKEMAQFLRQALAGERVVFNGETFRVNGYRLTRPPTQPIPIHVAALRPKMLAVAGAEADGVILNFLSAGDVRKSVAVTKEAARAAGKDPERIEVGARLFVSIDPPGAETGMVLKRWITNYLNVPTYRAFQEWLGRGPELAPMWDAWEAGDRRAALDAVPDVTCDALFIRGSAEERRAHLQRYFDAGVDTAYLHFMANEPDPVKHKELTWQAIKDMAPR
jgi:probable F420-dependent oxidoreductase